MCNLAFIVIIITPVKIRFLTHLSFKLSEFGCVGKIHLKSFLSNFLQIKKATVLIKKIKTIANKKEPTLYFYKIDSAITILNFKMGERSKLDVRGFESPKLPKQAKYIYGFVTKNHGLYNKKSPIKSDFFAVTSFLHNHYGGRRWIRTIEAKRNRFTVCPLWPLGYSPILSFQKSKPTA